MPGKASRANARIDVVYVDETLVVLNKPPELLAVPGRGPDKQDCLSARVQAQFADALVVHRLDMSTSGLIVMARGAAAQRALSAAFAQRQVHKAYGAEVDGLVQCPAQGWRNIDLPIALDWPQRPRRVVAAEGGQPSTTRLRLQSYDATRNTSRVELEPLTGRTHQLRVHLQAIGHPILGDALYAPAEVQARATRLLLHACALGFAHPLDGRDLHFTCAPDF
ncbi:MAG: RluA family pseudouridine synthase [Burkholderiales bacterium]|nr:RluA family pseudouridine synthase [Burkholderiales bacterium]